MMMGGILFLLMLSLGVIEAKRLLLVTTFLSAGIGISLAAALDEGSRSVVRKVVVAAGILALVGFAGSFANITSNSGWFTYRWLDEVEETVQRIESEHPGAVILSNSDVVAFYAGDLTGLDMPKIWFDNNLALVSERKVWNSLLRTDPEYGTLMERSLTSNTDVIYVHHAWFNASGSVGEMESVLRWLQALGFEQVDQWQSTPIHRGIERFLSLPDHPKYRITAIHLR